MGTAEREAENTYSEALAQLGGVGDCLQGVVEDVLAADGDVFGATTRCNHTEEADVWWTEEVFAEFGDVDQVLEDHHASGEGKHLHAPMESADVLCVCRGEVHEGR